MPSYIIGYINKYEENLKVKFEEVEATNSLDAQATFVTLMPLSDREKIKITRIYIQI